MDGQVITLTTNLRSDSDSASERVTLGAFLLDKKRRRRRSPDQPLIEKDEYFPSLYDAGSEVEICHLCGEFELDEDGEFESDSTDSIGVGPLKPIRLGDTEVYVHEQCALWSPEVFETKIGDFRNVLRAIRRGNRLNCSACRLNGATVGCFVKDCQRVFHYQCLRRSGGCFVLPQYHTYCPDHAGNYETEADAGLEEEGEDDEYFAATHLQGHIHLSPGAAAGSDRGSGDEDEDGPGLGGRAEAEDDGELPDYEIIRCICGEREIKSEEEGAGVGVGVGSECISSSCIDPWLQCHYCRSWLHTGCVFDLKKQIKIPHRYICPYCPTAEHLIESDQVASDAAHFVDPDPDAFADSTKYEYHLGDRYQKGFPAVLKEFQNLVGKPVDKLTVADLRAGVDICLEWGFYASKKEDLSSHFSSPPYWGPFLKHHLDNKDVDGCEFGAGKAELTTHVTENLGWGAIEIDPEKAKIGSELTSAYVKWFTMDILDEGCLQRLWDRPPAFFLGNLPFGPALALVFVAIRVLEKRLWLNRSCDRIPFALFFLPSGIFDESKYRCALVECLNMHVAAMHAVGRSNFGDYKFSQVKPTPDALWLLRVGRRDILNAPISFVNLRNWAPKLSARVKEIFEKRDKMMQRNTMPIYRKQAMAAAAAMEAKDKVKVDAESQAEAESGTAAGSSPAHRAIRVVSPVIGEEINLAKMRARLGPPLAVRMKEKMAKGKGKGKRKGSQ